MGCVAVLPIFSKFIFEQLFQIKKKIKTIEIVVK